MSFKPEDLPAAPLTDLYSKGFCVFDMDHGSVKDVHDYFKSLNQKEIPFNCEGVLREGGYTPPMFGISWNHYLETPPPVMAYWLKVLGSDLFKYFTSRYGDFARFHPSVAFVQPEEGLPWHNDYSTEKWHFSLAMYLTDEQTWDVGWGGTIHFGQWEVDPITAVGRVDTAKDISGPILPLHGRMVLINNARIDTAHRVEFLKLPKERTTVMMHLRLPGELTG